MRPVGINDITSYTVPGCGSGVITKFIKANVVLMEFQSSELLLIFNSCPSWYISNSSSY